MQSSEHENNTKNEEKEDEETQGIRRNPCNMHNAVLIGKSVEAEDELKHANKKMLESNQANEHQN